MLSLLLHTFTSVCVVTVVTAETVVGVAGRTVTLPCLSEAASQGGVEVCWGRGKPSLFTCHNAVINAAGEQVTYRRSYRYSMSSSSSLDIFNSRTSDSGFYHCRVQLPGLFNDQTSTVHLIIITPRSVVSETSGSPNAPRTTAGYTRGRLTETGNDVTGESATGPMVAQVQASVQQQQQLNSLQSFVGNTVRVSFIVFIPALLLTTCYRVWIYRQRSETDGSLNQSEGEEEERSV
ncbi:hepatitis A virus cellular receptor 1 homolog [Micropterus salmoides]|uniref:hepatitis A virus cellular receptor 1 homolog n=1 Tax=Micropterus salmoides TaxID=27706 RepID=UPI0018EDA417|nr:hepatitis A virus cellular receptor 1 homolog [Micropterus salmoides]